MPTTSATLLGLTAALVWGCQHTPHPPVEPDTRCDEAWSNRLQTMRRGAALWLGVHLEPTCPRDRGQLGDLAVLAGADGELCVAGGDRLRWERSTQVSFERGPSSRVTTGHLERLTPALEQLVAPDRGFDQGFAVSVACDASAPVWAYVLSRAGVPGQVGLVSEQSQYTHRGALPMVGEVDALLRGPAHPLVPTPSAPPDAGVPPALAEPASPSSPVIDELELAWERQRAEEETVRSDTFLASCGPADGGFPRARVWRSRSISTGSLAGPSHIVDRTVELQGDRVRMHVELSQELRDAAPRRLRPAGPFDVTRRVDFEGTVHRCAGGLQFVLRNTCLPERRLFFGCVAKTFTVAAPGALAQHVMTADDAEGCRSAAWAVAPRLRVAGYECHYQFGNAEDAEPSFVVGEGQVVERVARDNHSQGWPLLRRGSPSAAPAFSLRRDSP
ncbi:MAG: hypothetical protein JNK82_07610 [Myxococcaceae bacterium]|nr:hypothetical protein [Myxococcaceae bacterium]